MAKICIVDDNRASAKQLEFAVQAAGFPETVAFDRAVEALEYCRTHHTDVVLVDYVMPEMNGIRFLQSLQEHDSTRAIAPAMVSALNPATVKPDAYRAGAIEVLTKPLLASELRAKLGALVLEAQRRRQSSVEARDTAPPAPSNTQFLHCLAQIAAARADASGKHTARLAAYVTAIARALGDPDLPPDVVGPASQLHDIGNVVLPDWLLGAQVPLELNERRHLEPHTLAGFEILRELHGPVFTMAAEIALTHHEQWDGNGYPRGLAGEEIPLAGRVVAVADAFEAFTTLEGRDPVWLVTRARASIEGDAGSHFDPRVVRAFLMALDPIIAIKRQFDDDTNFAVSVERPHLPASN